MPYQAFDPSRYADSIGSLLLRRGDIEAQRAQTVAEAQARAAQVRGQAWGGAVQSIGQTLAAVPQQMQAQQQQALQDDTRRIQNEAGRLEIQSARKAAEDKSILGSAQGSGLEPEAVKAQLQQLGRGDLIPIYEQTHANLETARLGLQAKRTEVQGLESDYFGALAAGVKKAKYDPMAIDWALAQAEADGHDVKPIREFLQQKPDALPQLIDTLIEKSPTQRKFMGEEADRALKTATETRAAADMTADNTRATSIAAETARHNAEMERVATLTAGRTAAQAAETERHNRAMEENARNTKIGRPVIPGDAEDIAAIDEGLKLSRGMDFKQGDTGILPWVGGQTPDAITNLTGFGVGAKQRQGVINLTKQIIGKGLEGGVLRKEDESKYEKILPTLSDPPAVVEAKIQNLIKTLEQKRSTRLDAMEDAGYNVSKFRARQQSAAPGGSGVIVNMRAPDGTVQPVPAEQVEHYKAQGATVVGQ